MTRGCRNFVTIIAVALFIVFLIEAALQVRMFASTGQGLAALLTDRTRYRIDKETGLKLLNPLASRPNFAINSLGFRSAEVALAKPPALFRVVVVGASTVMGELAATNEDTFSALLEKKLNDGQRERRYEVVNAGIAGYRLRDQATLVRKKVKPLYPDLVILYPGFNDVSDFCGGGDVKKAKPYRLPTLGLPDWWISFNTLRRVSAPLRPRPPATAQKPLQKSAFDWSAYGDDLVALLHAAKSVSPRVVISSNARSFGMEQDEATRWRLSNSARSFAACLTVEDLIHIYDRLNAEIGQAAGTQGTIFVDLANSVPRGETYFGDATHFSRRGEVLVSDSLFAKLTHSDLLGDRQ